MGVFDKEFNVILGRLDNLEYQLARIACALEDVAITIRAKEKSPPATP